ncbi:hypothetical protein Tco_0895101 [Tanacetum coccineum]|uniref:Uncharacterized protein n=1 Tax=Tanacetum coccineum TaxID=301880 RepID=A0ABQ5CJX2_9ASTR
MADKGKNSSMETFMPNDKAYYYSGITSITVNRKNAYELKGKFLDDLHNNAFSETDGKDAVEHIGYYLRIIDPIKLPNVDHDKLRIIWTYLQKILWGLKLMEITKTIESTNGTRMYHGCMTSHGLIKEYRRSQHQSNILASLSTIKLDVRNGQPIARERMVIVMEEIFPVLTKFKTHSITNTLNAMIIGKDGRAMRFTTTIMIKYSFNEEEEYSFNDEEEYFAVKEDEYDDLTITSEEACRAYQEIFRIMNEGWKAAVQHNLAKNSTSRIYRKNIRGVSHSGQSHDGFRNSRNLGEKSDNKRKADDSSRNNHGHQQQPFKK